MQKINYFSILLVVVVVQLANGLYFHIAETERKCFIEEIPDETTVLGKQVTKDKWKNWYAAMGNLIVVLNICS